MDSLFDRINVRDLLSAHDLSDPSTPLSAPDLRLLVNRLEAHSQSIKSKVHSYILSHQHDFSSVFSQCNDIVSRTEELSSNLSYILALVSDRPVDVEIRELLDEIGSKAKEARVKNESLRLVKVIVGLSDRLECVRGGLRNGKLRSAAEELRELKQVLRIGNEEEGEPIVYGLLRKRWADCFDELQEVLVKFMEKAVQFEQEPKRVRVKYRVSICGADGIELRTALEAMEAIGILDYGLAKPADLMIKHVITPAVNYGSPLSFEEETNQGSEEIADALLKILPSCCLKMPDLDGEVVYSSVIQAIRFIVNRICFQNSSWIHSFGRLTWPRISDLIISNFLSKVVPEDASKLADFQRIIKQTSDFEYALKEMMFISAANSKDDRLSNFAENVEVHFAFRKKTEILAKARNLLLNCDLSVPQEYISKVPVSGKGERLAVSRKNVVDLLFSSERCVVSEAALQLMEIVHLTLKDVCVSSSRVAWEFYHAARDVILLYEAVLPVKLEKQLDGINQVAVLMHNDCLYLSREILGLAFQYRLDFPNSIKEHAVFADMAPRFHMMAEEILHRQIKLVISSLREAIDGADGFQNTHQMKQYESAKLGMDQVVFIIEKVHIIWEPLLSPPTYKRSICMILESVFSRITRDILLLDDLAAEETLQLQRLVLAMLESLSYLLENLSALNSEERSKDNARGLLNDVIPSLRKIRKLAELLDMPLKSITNAWESGDLQSCGFRSQEVEDFIRAIFADSPLRKECLRRIGNTRW